MPPGKGEIKPLTGLRGVAACWVVVYHLFLNGHCVAPLQAFLDHGYLAVDLFFVLSGFVMALSYEDFYRTRWTPKRYGIFLLHRVARIYPLYLFTTCLIALSIWLGFSKALPVAHLWRIFVINLLLIQNWGLSLSVNLVAWSISTEFAAYLLFPLLAWVALRERPMAAALLAAACAAVVYALQFCTPAHVAAEMLPPGYLGPEGPLDIFWPGPASLLRCLSEFCLGLIAYRLFELPRVKSVAAAPAAGYGIALIVLALTLFPGLDVLYVLFLPPLILCLACGDHGVARALSGRVAMFLGRISYALYLLHPQFLRIRRLGGARLAPHIGPVQADVIATAVLLVSLLICSWLAFRLIEKPGRAAIRRAERYLFAP
jgi:peptidoglycan/LPS O-acetylase OafA/YrhL